MRDACQPVYVGGKRTAKFCYPSPRIAAQAELAALPAGPRAIFNGHRAQRRLC
jgi:hypothetical protein